MPKENPLNSKRDFVEIVANITRELDALEWVDSNRFFTPTLQAMARDSARWLENEWKAPNGNTTPVERAIVVLAQDLIVLLGHASNAGIKHELLNTLAHSAIEAVESDLIEDETHRDYFTHPESPFHEILSEITE